MSDTLAALRQLGFEIHDEYLLPPVRIIPAGPFLMGIDPERDREAHPAFVRQVFQHTVVTAAFAMALYPVTVAEYALAVAAGAVQQPPPCMDVDWTLQEQLLLRPVVCVTWQAAHAYGTWLSSSSSSSSSGQTWRLPSEAEWEKAARGTQGAIFPWGDAWDASRANTDEQGSHKIVPIGRYPLGVSPYGMQEMAGNVWEWCQSLEPPYPYDAGDGREDMAGLGRRVLRGGSWAEPLAGVRASFRYADWPDFPLAHASFRLLCDVL
jgi:formylglycine-generating enzyme required for sulfatase activity